MNIWCQSNNPKFVHYNSYALDQISTPVAAQTPSLCAVWGKKFKFYKFLPDLLDHTPGLKLFKCPVTFFTFASLLWFGQHLVCIW